MPEPEGEEFNPSHSSSKRNFSYEPFLDQQIHLQDSIEPLVTNKLKENNETFDSVNKTLTSQTQTQQMSVASQQMSVEMDMNEIGETQNSKDDEEISEE